MALKNVLDKLASGSYGNEVPRYNAFEQAPALAQAIINWQKAQRMRPYAKAIEEYGSQWATADPETRKKLNERASQARKAFIEAGGSPYDLPRSYWGDNPQAGFQIGIGEYAPPYTGGNYTVGQTIKQDEARRKALLDALEERLKEAQITGVDPWTGQPTPEAQRLNLDILKFEQPSAYQQAWLDIQRQRLAQQAQQGYDELDYFLNLLNQL
ncbi:hypothetical protein GFC01_14180 [Desulfofundulus thermobenzoicus]|uniref:Uncharacterized protein n=1 Tax=Desulfofundulus thermobenzoicus TaxID=29376 RepID=A0A6N7ITD2_9FIRM|nr:hypothetical protein [Desulfofundulus thermobenzoicus]MQL53385.1 hypothetical protein [Desulfofundulus thermobenzoicus]